MWTYHSQYLRSLVLTSGILCLTAMAPRCATAQGMWEMPPFAADDFASTESTMSVTICVVANDFSMSAPIDPTTVTIIEPPATGAASVDPQTGEIEFTPDPGVATSDYLLYEVSDTNGLVSNPAFVWLVVIHRAPTAGDDFDTTSYTESVDIDVLSNDFGGTAPIDPGTVTIVTPPANGSASVDGTTGEVTYTPNNLFAGSDWFEYTVADSYGVDSFPARVNVVVANLPPEIAWFDAWADSYGFWVFEGQVQDERPENCTVEFGGIISGTTTPDATGYFQATIFLPPGTSGVATAMATDEIGEPSDTAETFVYGG